MPEAALSSLYAIVLAAGGSARFGNQPKQLVDIGSETLLGRAIRNALEICPLRVYTVLGYCSKDIIKIARSSTTHIVSNHDWQSGIASSIRAGIAALPRSANAVMITLCDQAKISADDLRLLADAWHAAPDQICAAAYGDTHGVPAIFPRSTFSQLRSLHGDSGAKSILQHMPDIKTVEIANAVFDLNTPEDLAKLAE